MVSKRRSFMEFKKLKIILLMLFVLLAGTFYSCSKYKDSNIISLEDSSDGTSVSVRDEELGHLEESQATNTDINLPEESSKNPDLDNDIDAQGETVNTPNFIYVHISGAVNNPGVYSVEESTRLYELIKIAGGLTSDAAGDYVNQAATLADSQQVYIPTTKEVKDSSNWQLTYSRDNGKESQGAVSSKVNINKASKEELMTLSGIGEAKANSIIQYREKHGSFKRIEDIMKISGIKQAAFNKISEDITVD